MAVQGSIRRGGRLSDSDEIHGPILDNLTNALASAQRLRGHPVYKDTLSYWNELVREAKRARRDPAFEQPDNFEDAIVKLEVELAERH